MTSGTLRYDPKMITVDCMYVLTRDAKTGGLRCGYESMGVRQAEIKQLEKLAQDTNDAERRIAESLFEELARIYEEAGSRGSLEEPLNQVVSDTTAIRSIVQQNGSAGAVARQMLLPAQGKHRGLTSRLFYGVLSGWDFGIPSGEHLILSCDEDDADKAVHAAARLEEARKVIDVARASYQEAFEQYLSRIEALVPGITSSKDYCTSLTDAFTELDYSDDPTNHQIVEDIVEYYRAQRIEEAISLLSKRADVVGYSTRRCGWRDKKGVDLHLDANADLVMTVRTNFGFGQSSYFHSTLSFMGINVLNADLVVFYSGVEESEDAWTTDIYMIEEQSFVECFEKAVGYQCALDELGAAGFIERYVKGSIEKLADLMYIIARSDTFLDITSLSLFSDLSSRGHSLIMPGTDLSEQYYKLQKRTEDLVTRFVESVGRSENDYGRIVTTYDQGILKDLQETLEIDNGRSISSQLAQLELARSELVSRTRKKCGDANWITPLYNSKLPMPRDYRLLHLDGYSLQRFRTEKAGIVLTLLSNIRKACRTTSCESIIETLVDSCVLIRKQDDEYLRNYLILDIAKLEQELDQLKGEIESIEAQLEGSEDEEIAQQLKSLRGRQSNLSWKLNEMRGRRLAFKRYSERLDRALTETEDAC